MAHRRLYRQSKFWWVLLLVVTLHLHYACSVESWTPNANESATASLTDAATQADIRNADALRKDGANTTTNLVAELTSVTGETLATGGDTSPSVRNGNTHTIAVNSTVSTSTINGDHEGPTEKVIVQLNRNQQAPELGAAVGSPTESPQSKGFSIHWLLFTSWQMPLVLVCVEIFAYCVTIFIVFGFSKKRSRVKRFGHFSWKGPNTFQLEGMSSGAAARSHFIAAEPTDGRGRVKKPSIRGHRP